MADLHGAERGRPVCRVQPPVFLQLPGQEAEHARNAGRHERDRREREAPLHAGGVYELGGDHRNHRHEELVRHGHHGEMLDRVELRLDEQRDAESHAGLDNRPHRAEDGLDREHQPRLVGAKSQALVDRVERALDEVHRPPEGVDDPGEEPHDHVQVKLVQHPAGRLDHLLLKLAAHARVEHHRARGEHARGDPGRGARQPAAAVRQHKPGRQRDESGRGGMADQPADGCAAENELDDGQPE